MKFSCKYLKQIFSVTANSLGKLGTHSPFAKHSASACALWDVLYTEVSMWGMRSFSCTSIARNYCGLF